jgi:pimeloyl-ACP methyl ester carboxylesterase
MAAGELSRLETSCRPWRRAVRSSNSKDTADVADRPFSFEQSADDTAALLQHLKIDRADFFGFSNGGNIALQIAIRHPKRVRKLVVASAMFKGDGLYPEVWQFMKRATLQNMPQELQEAYRKAAPHPEQLPTFHDKCAKRMLEFKDWRPEDIRSIEAPTLLMLGDADSSLTWPPSRPVRRSPNWRSWSCGMRSP